MSSLAASLISALILTTVFTVMWRNHRERWIGMWAVAAALWTARYLLAILGHEYRYVPGAHLLPLIALARGFFLLCGSYQLAARRRLPAVWMAIFVADLAVLAYESVVGDLRIAGAYAVTHYAVFSAATLWSAVLAVRQRATLGRESLVVGVGLTAMSIANATFPWASRQPAISDTLFFTVHAAQLLIGFGALMIFYRRVAAERESALVRLESANASLEGANDLLEQTNTELAESNSRLAEALEKALSGYLPICAHCKAIQNAQGEWEPLERYFMTRHDAAFSHGICEPCADKHYGDILRTA